MKDEIKRIQLEEYKEKYCVSCLEKYMCCDSNGELLDEQVKICMSINKIKENKQ